MMQSRWRAAGKSALLLVASCVVSVLALEVGVRVAAPQPPVPEWYAEDPALGHVLRPNFHQRYPFAGSDFVMDVRINSAGLRDIEQDLAQPAPGKTLLLIGDSFVFGYGVNLERRFDSRLRSLFHAEGNPVRVINAGVPGWGTLQEVRFTEANLARFMPDAIVIVYCGNDQQDDRGVREGTTVFRERGLFAFPGKRWLRAHSHTYRLAFYASSAWRQSMAARSQERAEPAAKVDAQSAAVLTEADWVRTGDLIRGLSESFRRRRPSGVIYLVATEPDDPNLSGPLGRIADGDRIRYLDLASRAREIPAAERRLGFDPHWSPRMHALVADAIHDALRAQWGETPEATPRSE